MKVLTNCIKDESETFQCGRCWVNSVKYWDHFCYSCKEDKFIINSCRVICITGRFAYISLVEFAKHNRFAQQWVRTSQASVDLVYFLFSDFT